MSRRAFLGMALCAVLVYAGLDWVGAHVELVTLHVSSGYSDHYPRVFIVDDPPVVWVRAERPDRIWLEALRANPEVSVRRNGGDFAYHAEVGPGDVDRARVDRLFRAKYGVFDRVSAWFWRRNAVPVRLEPRRDLASSS